MKGIKQDNKNIEFMFTGWNNNSQTIVCKAIYRFDTIPIKGSIFFTKIQRRPKFQIKLQKTQNSEINHKQKEQNGGIILPYVILYCRAKISKTAWY